MCSVPEIPQKSARKNRWTGLGRRLAYLWRGLWPSAYTVLASLVVALVWLTGGRVVWRRSQGTLGLCAYGGWLARVLRWHPFGAMQAVTLGHVVIAQDAAALAATLAHEFTHIRQFERWGLLFPLLYSLEALRAACCGAGAYAGNRFERAAQVAQQASD